MLFKMSAHCIYCMLLKHAFFAWVLYKWMQMSHLNDFAVMLFVSKQSSKKKVDQPISVFDVQGCTMSADIQEGVCLLLGKHLWPTVTKKHQTIP